ncbi:MAG: aminotransferase class V-fold PLP-dependent enzyme [Pirellula sp.]|nr:aminotransferase class V-fold PLP-dependent enzyme [Pirellula sp.]
MSVPNERFVLLNPGPVTLTDTVRDSLTQRDMCHRESAFSDLMRDVRGQLCHIYDSEQAWTSVLLTGSGTAAVESMVSSLVSGERTALVAANGVYGERIESMLKHAGKCPVMVRSEWADPIDFDAVEAKLQQESSIKHVIAVHHETTTGRLNDLGRLAELCTRYGKRMLIDGVSSFGGEKLDLDHWPIDGIAATANKCLHGIPGIAFVLVPRTVSEKMRPSASSLYLDLATNHSAQEKGYPAFTPAIQSLYALKQALIELEAAGGWQQRHQLYCQRSTKVAAALEEIEIQPLLVNATDRSSVLTAYRLPRDCDYDSLSQPLIENRIVIYAGQKELERIIFRVAVMGDLREDDFERFFQTIGEARRS